jgi:hypothetical protein
MTSGELVAALKSAPQGTERWAELARETAQRVRFGSLAARHMPDGYDPDTWLLPAPDTAMEDAP